MIQFLFQGITNNTNQSHRINIKTLFIFRICSALFMIYALIQTSYITKTFSQNFLYLTLWGAYSTYFYFTLISIENINFFYFKNKQLLFSQTLWQCCQLLFIVAFCLEIPIMLIYWGYIFPQDNISGYMSWLINIDLHAICGCLILIDFFINDIQFKWKQSILLICISIIYLLINMTFVLITDREIYPGINWKNIISYIVSVVTVMIVFGVFSFGVWYFNKIKQPLIVKNSQLLNDSMMKH